MVQNHVFICDHTYPNTSCVIDAATKMRLIDCYRCPWFHMYVLLQPNDFLACFAFTRLSFQVICYRCFTMLGRTMLPSGLGDHICGAFGHLKARLVA